MSKKSIIYFFEYFNFSKDNPFLNIDKLDNIGDWIDAKDFIDSFCHEVDIARDSNMLLELEILYSSFDLVGIYPIIDEALRGETKYQDLLNKVFDSIYE